jgi:hypothetical protein
MMQTISLLFTASQGTWFALILASPLIALRLGKRTFLLAVFVVPFLLLGFYFVVSTQLTVYRSSSGASLNLFEFLTIEPGRTDVREDHLFFTLAAIPRDWNWLFGLGFGTRIGLGASVIARAQQEHITILKLLLEVGIFGLGTFFFLIGRLWLHGLRLARKLQGRQLAIMNAFLCIIVVLLLVSLTHDVTSNRGLWLTLGLISAALRISVAPEQVEGQDVRI